MQDEPPAKKMTVLTTDRLRLEPFAPVHFEAIHALNADPGVMRYITGRPETREETRQMFERVQARWKEWGYSWWAFVERSTGEVVGCGPIQHIERDARNPVEVGWRIRADRRRQGLALEAATAMARFAFEQVGVPELIAVCQQENTASEAVMRRLGMRLRGIEHWYEREVTTYAMSAQQWRQRAVAA